METIILVTGSMAAFLTTIAFLPQVIKTHQTKHTKDLSLSMYILFSIGLIFWTIYGVYYNSMPIILANAVTLGLSLYLIYLKVKYG